MSHTILGKVRLTEATDEDPVFSRLLSGNRLHRYDGQSHGAMKDPVNHVPHVLSLRRAKHTSAAAIDAQYQVVLRVLDDLELSDVGALSDEVVNENGSRHERAVMGRADEITHAPRPNVHPRQRSSTTATARKRHADVLDLVAHEGHAEVVEIRDQQVSRFAGGHRLAVHFKLQVQAFRVDVQAVVCLALAGGVAALA